MIYYLEFVVKFFAFLFLICCSSLMAEEAEEKSSSSKPSGDEAEEEASVSFGAKRATDEFSNDFHLKEGTIKTIERGMESATAKFEIITDLFLSG